jgi:hypothetical protein
MKSENSSSDRLRSLARSPARTQMKARIDLPLDIEKVGKLLERAARKSNESADATCAVVAWFDRLDGDANGMFNAVSNSVNKLAVLSMKGSADYQGAARELLKKLAAARRGPKHA